MIGFQGLVSHFNMDIRAGWLNYIFIGTETIDTITAPLKRKPRIMGWCLLCGTLCLGPSTIAQGSRLKNLVLSIRRTIRLQRTW